MKRPDQKALETAHDMIWKKAKKVGNKFTGTKDHLIPRYMIDIIFRKFQKN